MGDLGKKFCMDVFSSDCCSNDSSRDSVVANTLARRWYEIKARGLWYKKPDTRSHGYILKNISCEALSGEILAIAGPTGAGTYTLLKVLGGWAPSLWSSDTLLLNDQSMLHSRFRRLSAFVTQDDALFPWLTLTFSARLRLLVVEWMMRVETVLAELGLTHVAESHVARLSGGERRRVSIGVDIIHNPKVLILDDEPTSGLDSTTTLHVTRILRTMAKMHSRILILTIHQPNFLILQMMSHNILLLSKGSVVHCAPLEHLSNTLTALGHVIPAHTNFLEYAIDIINLIRTHPLVEPLITILKHTAPSHRIIKNHRHTYANQYISEITILAHRFSINIMCSNDLFLARTLQALIMGIVLGTIFLQVGANQRDLQARLGFLAFTVTFLLSSTTEGLPIFLQEHQIMTRQNTHGAFKIFSYVVANTLVFLPFLFVIAMLYAFSVYWLVGLSPSWSAFTFFLLVVWIVVLVANSIVALFATLVPDYIIGHSLIAGSMGAFFLFLGYFISCQKIPKYWLPMHYISLFKYPFEALVANEFDTLQDLCVEHMVTSEGPCLFIGYDFLQQQGLAVKNKWLDVVILIAFVVMYWFLCLFILLIKMSKTGR